jgi:hypothetical protein
VIARQYKFDQIDAPSEENPIVKAMPDLPEITLEVFEADSPWQGNSLF